ncbi:MAG: HAD-IC family P-type ATPase [Anaerolineae bacterium]
MGYPIGLTDQEVLERHTAGKGNLELEAAGRTYWDIIRHNLLSYFSLILFSICIILVVLGQYGDAQITASIGFVNALIGTFQEIRAKRQLEKISLFALPRVIVLRNKREQEVAAVDLVEGDIIRLQAGDQAVVDGRLLSSAALEMDESLLTGEADSVHKLEGAEVLSGSFCLSGNGYYRAEKVGGESFANQLTAAARVFEPVHTPLQAQVNYVVRLIMIIALIMGAIFYIAGFVQGFTLIENIKATAVITGLVPYGLFLTVAVTYALGSAKIAQQGALVQQSNAVESLHHVDVLCLDKTGTLTANQMHLDAIIPLHDDVAQGEVTQMLGRYVRSSSLTNATSQAIAAGTGGEKLPVAKEITFSSSRRWSAIAFEQDGMSGAYVLGAWEMVLPYLTTDNADKIDEVRGAAEALSEKGMRVLLFAGNAKTVALHNENGAPELPILMPLALVSLRNEIRPMAAETLAEFVNLGLQLKILSGDNPDTVVAVAKQAGLQNLSQISGPDLAELTPAEQGEAITETVVFGRMTPEQKQLVVSTLNDQGHYVAMIGDGVNDVLSLKKAKLGIAMQSGSHATRNVADMVLLDDSYAALIPALAQGKKMVNGIRDATYLLAARGLCYAMVIIGVMMVGLSFPFEPSQLGLTAFSVGIPAFLLTLFAPAKDRDESLLHSILTFVLPFTILTMLMGVGLYAYFSFQITNELSSDRLPDRAIERFENNTGLTFGEDAQFEEVVVTFVGQTNLSNFLSIATMLMILFLYPPIQFFAVWRPVTPDKRPALVTIALVIAYALILEVDIVHDHFGISSTPGWIWGIQAMFLAVWLFSFRFVLKHKWVEKLLIASD